MPRIADCTLEPVDTSPHALTGSVPYSDARIPVEVEWDTAGSRDVVLAFADGILQRLEQVDAAARDCAARHYLDVYNRHWRVSTEPPGKQLSRSEFIDNLKLEGITFGELDVSFWYEAYEMFGGSILVSDLHGERFEYAALHT